MDKRKKIIRIGKSTLSFTVLDGADKETPVHYEPYTVKGGISMAANLREAFKTTWQTANNDQRLLVLLDTPSMQIPIEQFEEQDINELYNYTFSPSSEPRKLLYNVLPDLKTVCLFPINKDLWGVLNDRFDDPQFIHAMTPVWRHLHQRSFTGHYSKLYAYFHGHQLDLVSFQQNRFKFCNTFEAGHAHDALYFILHTWNQLRLDINHDELHLLGAIPEQKILEQELKQYLQKVYILNPVADFNQAPVTKIEGMPYDLMTLIVRGR